MDEGAIVKAGARIGPYSRRRPAVLRGGARVDRAGDSSGPIPECVRKRVRAAARFSAVSATSAERGGRTTGVVLGDKSVVTDLVSCSPKPKADA